MLNSILKKARTRLSSCFKRSRFCGGAHTRRSSSVSPVIALALALGMLPQFAWPASQVAVSDLETIIARQVPQGFAISLQMADVGTGRILAEKNPDLALTPASTMKVVTSAAALRTLGPHFTFVTEALVADINGDSAGSLYLRGGGDPYLVSEQLFKLVGEIKDQGLVEIRDKIVVDDSFFSPEKPMDEQERLGPRAYHAPYSALSLNFNSMKVLVRPGTRPGGAAVIASDPLSEYASLVNGVKTVAGASPPKLIIEKEPAQSGREVVKISGTIGVKSPVKGRYVNVSSPSLYLGEVFKEFLLREGVRVRGNVVKGRIPSSAVSYVKFRSPPLGLLVYWLNKFSNNFMAEQINLGMGAFLYGAPGTREKGLSAIRANLDELGVNRECYAAAEASGLSRTNKLSASALVRVLLATSKDFSCGAEFIASLGVAGTDGTLKEKFTDPAVKGRIRAKTGNLRGVNALAGFASLRNGRTLAFAVVVNSVKDGAGFIDYGERVIKEALATLDASVDLR